ncbi:MAG: mechanosensitive ion channel [Myxococcales bacterium]|nr:mechanosensitive ion channel [Myxococcales bacterium]
MGGLIGEVKEISTRSVTIETFDGRLVLIPNAEILTSKVINWSLGPSYVWVKAEVGVAYGSDTRLVQKLLLEIAQRHPKVLTNPQPAVRFNSFGSSSLDFALWIAVADPVTRFAVLSELRYEIDDVFREHDIVIAFPQQDIHLNANLEEVLVQAFKNQSVIALQGPPPPKNLGSTPPRPVRWKSFVRPLHQVPSRPTHRPCPPFRATTLATKHLIATRQALAANHKSPSYLPLRSPSSSSLSFNAGTNKKKNMGTP